MIIQIMESASCDSDRAVLTDHISQNASLAEPNVLTNSVTFPTPVPIELELWVRLSRCPFTYLSACGTKSPALLLNSLSRTGLGFTNNSLTGVVMFQTF